MGALDSALPKINKRLAASGSTYKGMNGILLLIMEGGNKRRLRP